MQPTTYPVKVAIVGRAKDTANYENALRQMGAQSLTSMDVKSLSAFHGLLLPGGGDIAPAFFGQKNQGSRNIDIEWHPERLFPGFARQTPQGQQAADGRILFRYFLSLCASL